MSEPCVVGRIHRVHYTVDPSKHTVDLATRAIAACREDLKGFADPEQRSGMAVIGGSTPEVIERLRCQLAVALQLAFGHDVDLQAFKLQVAIAEVKDGKFFSSFGAIYGSRFDVHKPN